MSEKEKLDVVIDYNILDNLSIDELDKLEEKTGINFWDCTGTKRFKLILAASNPTIPISKLFKLKLSDAITEAK